MNEVTVCFRIRLYQRLSEGFALYSHRTCGRAAQTNRELPERAASSVGGAAALAVRAGVERKGGVAPVLQKTTGIDGNCQPVSRDEVRTPPCDSRAPTRPASLSRQTRIPAQRREVAANGALADTPTTGFLPPSSPPRVRRSKFPSRPGVLKMKSSQP